MTEIQDRPRVSVILPTYNRGQCLVRCLESLAKQTYPNYEVIVVDDGSTDDTPLLLERFVADHPDVTLHCMTHDTNLGANASRNRGIARADGTFIAFLDSDSIAEPDWIEKLMYGFVSDRIVAVVGSVIDPPPENIFELAFKGTHRIDGNTFARRLVMGNMCVRRSLLMKYPLEEDLKYGCDEEGIFLRLRNAGYEYRVVSSAIIWHQHHYTAKSYFRQAWIGGKAASWLVYKYYLSPRLDMLPFLLAYITVPLIVVHRYAFYIPLFFFFGALIAITYNDLFRKGKTVWETLCSFPVLLAYYHVRLAGYVWQSLRLRLVKNNIQRTLLKKQY